MKTIFYQFISIYCVIKDLMGIPPGFFKKTSFLVGLLIQTCLITLSITIMSFLAIIILIIQIFLWFIDLWLISKLGSNYGGRLKGQDPIFEARKEKVIMSSLLILNINEDHTIINNRLQEMFKNVHNRCYKLSCTVENCLGYAYYVKNQVTSKECCEFVEVNDKEYLTRGELLEYIRKNYMVNVCNQKRLWYGTVFKQPILWNKQSETRRQIAVLFIIRHCIGDGPSVMGMLKQLMLQEEGSQLIKIEPKYTTKPTFTLDDAYVYRNGLTSGTDESVFETPGADRQLVLYAEDEIKYVPLVKKLKNKLGMGFTEILIACLTASLAKLLEKRGKTMEQCTTGNTYKPIDEDFINIINGTFDYNNVTNNLVVLAAKSPFTMQGGTLLDRCKSIGMEYHKAKSSIDGLAHHTVMKIAHFIPSPVMELLLFMSKLTVGATNVGELNVGTLAGFEVEAVAIFAPFLYDLSNLLSVITKNDRLQLCLTVRENIMSTRQEAEEVLDNMFRFIDELCEELNIT